MARAKRKREEWPYLVHMFPAVGGHILRASVAEWRASPTSKGRPFIQFVCEMPNGDKYKFLVMPQFEKYYPRPEVVEEVFAELETRLKEKADEALRKKAEKKAEKEAKNDGT